MKDRKRNKLLSPVTTSILDVAMIMWMFVFMVACDYLPRKPEPVKPLPVPPPVVSHADKMRAMVVKTSGATAYLEVAGGSGSAFNISMKGRWVTAAHMWDPYGDGKATIVVYPGTPAEKEIPARFTHISVKYDLAVLEPIKPLEDSLPYLNLGYKKDLEILKPVWAFGYPFGKSSTVKEDREKYPVVSINHGYITALRENLDGHLDYIQIDAMINGGNSGGPVVDADGTVMGVVNMGFRGSGVNYAVTVDCLREFLGWENEDF